MLDELRKKQLLCDTIFKVEEKHFHVHRCVLAATSPYFKTMFTEDWTEGQESIVELPDAKECGFEQVLCFAYTGHAELNRENIGDVLMSANHYCYPALNELCVKYMLATIDENNCLRYMKLAEMYDAKNVLDKADEIVLNNYSTVVQDPAFVNISKDALCQFLVSDKLHQNTSELEIFQSVCTWLTHQAECTLATELMQHVQFNLISSGELREHVFKSDVVRQDKLCMDLVLDKILQNYEGADLCCEDTRNCQTIRNMSLKGCRFREGPSGPGPSLNSYFLLFASSQCLHSTDMPLRSLF